MMPAHVNNGNHMFETGLYNIYKLEEALVKGT